MIDTQKYWYALRVTYQREMKVKGYFDDLGVETFIPMQTVERVVSGRKRKAVVPAIHNLIFVRIEPPQIKHIKQSTALPICYIMNPESKSPVTIDDRQMRDFITVCNSRIRSLQWEELSAAELKSGDQVEITEGMFCGVRGVMVRRNGRGRFVVSIEVAAVSISIPAKSVKKISEEIPA